MQHYANNGYYGNGYYDLDVNGFPKKKPKVNTVSFVSPPKDKIKCLLSALAVHVGSAAVARRRHWYVRLLLHLRRPDEHDLVLSNISQN